MKIACFISAFVLIAATVFAAGGDCDFSQKLSSSDISESIKATKIKTIKHGGRLDVIAVVPNTILRAQVKPTILHIFAELKKKHPEGRIEIDMVPDDIALWKTGLAVGSAVYRENSKCNVDIDMSIAILSDASIHAYNSQIGKPVPSIFDSKPGAINRAIPIAYPPDEDVLKKAEMIALLGAKYQHLPEERGNLNLTDATIARISKELKMSEDEVNRYYDFISNTYPIFFDEKIHVIY